jgi:hypothetical protein
MGEVDVAKYFEFPRMTPCGLVDLVNGAARNIARVVDENVDVGCILYKPCDILRLAQIDDVRGGIDLMSRSQAFGQRLQLLAAARREPEMSAFFGKGFGGSRADALRCAGDQHALAAQMEVHGIARWL